MAVDIEEVAKSEEEPQGQQHAHTEEKSDPWDLLFAEMDAIKARLTQLEAVAHSGHELDGNAISHIATVAVERINESIRARFGRVS